MIAPLIGRYLNMIRTLLFSTELFDRINLVVKSHNRRSGSGILMPWAPGSVLSRLHIVHKWPDSCMWCRLYISSKLNGLSSKIYIYTPLYLNFLQSPVTDGFLSLRWSAPPGRWRWRWSHKDPLQSGHSAPLSPEGRNTGRRGRRAQSPGPRPPQTAPQGEKPGPCGRWWRLISLCQFNSAALSMRTCALETMMNYCQKYK